jgi:coenzyme F420-0:L-glutamate ligase/coenzyme F420-1:gamma-L-glutamate ligase
LIEINLIGLTTIPLVKKDDNLLELIIDSIKKESINVKDGDIFVIAETLISKIEGNYIKLNDIVPSNEALKLAKKTKKDPQLMEAILNESNEVVRVGPNFIITETKHGFVCANAGIDESNVEDGYATPIPINPDDSAKYLRLELEKYYNRKIGVIISDTQGRAFRVGAIGTAIGCSGIVSLWNRQGEEDLYGRELQTTEIAVADELAASASLLMGQANEGIPIVIVRNHPSFDIIRDENSNINPLIRPKEFDAFR